MAPLPQCLLPKFDGRPVVVVGGGPSFSLGAAETLRVMAAGQRGDGLRAGLVVVNNAYQRLACAHLHYFCDGRWYALHRTDPQWAKFEGVRATPRHNAEICATVERLALIDLLDFDPDQPGQRSWPLPPDPLRPAVYTGNNGGFQAVSLAYWCGAGEIILIGFDGCDVNGRGHWHPDHPWDPIPETAYSRWGRNLFLLIAALRGRGVRVTNCSRHSCYPGAPFAGELENALARVLQRPVDVRAG